VDQVLSYQVNTSVWRHMHAHALASPTLNYFG
jgi:hypothetical protein